MRDIINAGADFLVLGSSSLFTPELPLEDAINKIMELSGCASPFIDEESARNNGDGI